MSTEGERHVFDVVTAKLAPLQSRVLPTRRILLALVSSREPCHDSSGDEAWGHASMPAMNLPAKPCATSKQLPGSSNSFIDSGRLRWRHLEWTEVA